MRNNRAVYINDVFLFVFAVSCIITGTAAFYTGSVYRGLGGFAALLCLPFLPLVRRTLLLEKNRSMENELLLFVFLAFLLGVVLGWYSLLSFYDNLVHFLSGVVFTTVGLCFFWLIREDRSADRKKDYPVAVGFSFCFAQFTAVLWEIFEFVSGRITGHDSQNVAATGVADTMEDMIACMLGSLLMSAVIYFCLKHDRSCFLLHPADEFYELNCRDLGDAPAAERRPQNRNT